MKSKVGPGAIAAGVVALIVVLFLIYRFTLGGNPAQPPITPDNRPDYVKQLQAGKTPAYYGAPASGAANTQGSR